MLLKFSPSPEKKRCTRLFTRSSWSSTARRWSGCRPPEKLRSRLRRPPRITLSEARSRLDRSRFSRPNTHFAAFVKIYKKTIFSRANFANFCQKIAKFCKNFDTFFGKFCKILQNFQKYAKFLQNLQNFLLNFREMRRF